MQVETMEIVVARTLGEMQSHSKKLLKIEADLVPLKVT